MKGNCNMNDYEPNLGGKILHCKRSDGYEEWAQYDKKGRLIHKKSSDGKERWIKYNSKGRKSQEINKYGKKLSIDMIRQET